MENLISLYVPELNGRTVSTSTTSTTSTTTINYVVKTTSKSTITPKTTLSPKAERQPEQDGPGGTSTRGTNQEEVSVPEVTSGENIYSNIFLFG